jgi:hypothetical protein
MKIVAIAACIGIMSTGVQAEERMIPNYRTTHGVKLVCYTPYGANWDPCSRMPLSLVKKIDVMAEDVCNQGPNEMGPPTIPHAIYGDAGALNYRCVGRLRRDNQDENRATIRRVCLTFRAAWFDLRLRG